MTHLGIARLKSAAGAVAIALTLSACGSSQSPDHTSPTEAKSADPLAGTAERPFSSGATPLTAQKLKQRLLAASDLGPAYKAVPQAGEKDDNDGLGPCKREFARYGIKDPKELDLAAEVKLGFALEVGDGRSVLQESLSTDTPKKLAAVYKIFFDVLSTCGPLEAPAEPGKHGKITIEIEKAPLPTQKLGEEQYAIVSTSSWDSESQATKTVGVRDGNVGTVLTGPPDMVDQNIARAVAKAKVGK
ncbi:hypothetical protein [Streptomyces triculaminicus]|uniref:hypothetical protein n=1 Tax=Streptomyces triculaminicus TaxID=2816232 RepID=UPI0037AEB55A